MSSTTPNSPIEMAGIEAARDCIEEALKNPDGLFELAAIIGTFADDPPDSEFQLQYLATIAREFYFQIDNWKLPPISETKE